MVLLMKCPKMTPVLIAVALTVAGCQGGGSKAADPPSRSPASESCDRSLSSSVKAAMKRVADIPVSVKTSFIGHPQRTADQVVARYEAGGVGDLSSISFCGAYKGSSGLDSVMVSYYLPEDSPGKGQAAETFKEYRMGKLALAGVKVGVLYFECTSGKFSGSSGAPVLIRGEVRSRYEASESAAAARTDNLRILHGSSRTLASLLNCETSSGLSDTFSMPPEA
ncbi:hypothetical protein [Streptomyces sp. NPDC050548]|uniref:hypothetical protein n=1 Tax=Streptomyces sp. NPDC050548 TaxID=3365629 RepID=UPI0037BC695C